MVHTIHKHADCYGCEPTKQVRGVCRIDGAVAERIVRIFGDVLANTWTCLFSNVGTFLFALSKLSMIKKKKVWLLWYTVHRKSNYTYKLNYFCNLVGSHL